MNSTKNLFVLGDSIAYYYFPYLEKALIDRFFCRHKGDKNASIDCTGIEGANGGNSQDIIQYLMTQPVKREEYILLNCGLHDIKRTQDGIRTITDAQYKDNLHSIIGLIKDMPLVWVMTTPVDDVRHQVYIKDYFRRDEDVVRINSIAKGIMDENNIPIIDLYKYTSLMQIEKYRDHVHFTEQVSALQAAYIAEQLRLLIG